MDPSQLLLYWGMTVYCCVALPVWWACASWARRLAACGGRRWSPGATVQPGCTPWPLSRIIFIYNIWHTHNNVSTISRNSHHFRRTALRSVSYSSVSVKHEVQVPSLRFAAQNGSWKHISGRTCKEDSVYTWSIYLYINIFGIQNFAVKWLPLLFHIRKVRSSNRGSKTGYSDWGLSWYYLSRSEQVLR